MVSQVPVPPQVPYQVPQVPQVQMVREELPFIPVEKYNEPSQRYSRHTKVKADKIYRTPEGVIVHNPSRIEVNEIIPKEYGKNYNSVSIPGQKSVKIEPIYTNSKKITGTPVRAIDDFFPETRSELSLKKGQPVLYLCSKNGWSRIRTSNGAEGYVPHYILSK